MSQCGGMLQAMVRYTLSLCSFWLAFRSAATATGSVDSHWPVCNEVLDIQHASVCGTAMANVVDQEFEAELRAAVQQRSSSIVRVGFSFQGRLRTLQFIKIPCQHGTANVIKRRVCHI